MWGLFACQALRQFASVLGVALTVLLLGTGVADVATFRPIFGLILAGGVMVRLISRRLPRVVEPALVSTGAIIEPVV